MAAAPNGSAYREALARALEKIGDTDAALRVLTDGIAICPEQPAPCATAPFCCASADGISNRRRDWPNRLGLVVSPTPALSV